MALVGDAVGLGLIESLARPGHNVTGITDESVALSAKRLEFLKEAVPKAVRMAILWNADDRGMTLRYREVEKAAQMLHVTVQPLGVREPNDFEMAFSAMSYGPDYRDVYRRAAGIVHRILRGTKPADLPVEQPTKYELVINLKTAKALGLTIPPSLLGRADEVIQ